MKFVLDTGKNVWLWTIWRWCTHAKLLLSMWQEFVRMLGKQEIYLLICEGYCWLHKQKTYHKNTHDTKLYQHRVFTGDEWQCLAKEYLSDLALEYSKGRYSGHSLYLRTKTNLLQGKCNKAKKLSMLKYLKGVYNSPIYIMNAKLSKHGFWHCHEIGLIKTNQTILHNL